MLCLPSYQFILADIVQAMGAESATAIPASRLTELLAARAPEELDVSRDLPPPDDLVINNHDWHLQQTHLVKAWDLLGGPDSIDWQDIRVGQIDTGFRPIPCLGFGPDGKSGFVLTDADRKAGRPAPAAGYSAVNFDKAQAIVLRAKR
jgi:hypothetical protein